MHLSKFALSINVSVEQTAQVKEREEKRTSILWRVWQMLAKVPEVHLLLK